MFLRRKKALDLLAMLFTAKSYLALIVLLANVLFLALLYWVLRESHRTILAKPTLQFIEKLAYEFLRPEYRSPLVGTLLSLFLGYLMSFYVWRLIAHLTKAISAGSFFQPSSSRYLRHLRCAFLIGFLTDLFYATNYNRLIDLILPIIGEDLRTPWLSVLSFGRTLYVDWLNFVSLEPGPSLKLLFALICTLCLQMIERAQELDREVTELRDEQQFIV